MSIQSPWRSKARWSPTSHRRGLFGDDFWLMVSVMKDLSDWNPKLDTSVLPQERPGVRRFLPDDVAVEQDYSPERGLTEGWKILGLSRRDVHREMIRREPEFQIFALSTYFLWTRRRHLRHMQVVSKPIKRKKAKRSKSKTLRSLRFGWCLLCLTCFSMARWVFPCFLCANSASFLGEARTGCWRTACFRGGALV